MLPAWACIRQLHASCAVQMLFIAEWSAKNAQPSSTPSCLSARDVPTVPGSQMQPLIYKQHSQEVHVRYFACSARKGIRVHEEASSKRKHDHHEEFWQVEGYDANQYAGSQLAHHLSITSGTSSHPQNPSDAQLSNHVRLTHKSDMTHLPAMRSTTLSQPQLRNIELSEVLDDGVA